MKKISATDVSPVVILGNDASVRSKKGEKAAIVATPSLVDQLVGRSQPGPKGSDWHQLKAAESVANQWALGGAVCAALVGIGYRGAKLYRKGWFTVPVAVAGACYSIGRYFHTKAKRVEHTRIPEPAKDVRVEITRTHDAERRHMKRNAAYGIGAAGAAIAGILVPGLAKQHGSVLAPAMFAAAAVSATASAWHAYWQNAEKSEGQRLTRELLAKL